MKKEATFRELYSPAMKIEDQKKANQYFEELVKRNISFGDNNKQEAEKIEKMNLGYYAGYYSGEIRERVEKLFKCSHPVFGKISEHIPTAQEAFKMGKKIGEQIVGRQER